MGRKIYLVVGSTAGGRRAALLYSMANNAKANGAKPFAGLKEVFARLPSYGENRGDGIHTCEAFAQAFADEPVKSAE